MQVQDLIPYVDSYTKIRINTNANTLFSGNKEKLLESDTYLFVCSLEINEIGTENDNLAIGI